ncbi:sulfotransferase domain-containing protein [Saccharopolyspora karakumensis]|uniref:sulfotransferase domain-containing protein n=1 Tax=Saccharopolyspora karakumensis TaxID=2530386 RepID=UPI001A9E3850|nr:sulfotransferase domain-containing protein [Saccharopolyspora karakumensis]
MALRGPPERRRYRSPQQDSARWDDFPLREGDIVISAPAKSGTTWVQMMCALLIFQEPELPQPLSTLSPWLDQLLVPQEEMYAKLAEQEHRRVIKTHVPLDGLPLDARVSYIVAARHPLDRALSLYHQAANIHAEWLRAFQDEPDEQSATARTDASSRARVAAELVHSRGVR